VRISVTPAGGDVYTVEVEDGRGATRHEVTARPEDVAALGGGASAERLVEESFRFLLEREPKESILRSFDLPVIRRYFPEYADEIGHRTAS